MHQQQLNALINDYPLVARLQAFEPLTWFNPRATTLEKGLPFVGLGREEVAQAEQRLTRFAPYLSAAFPETRAAGGIIESELVAIDAMRQALNGRYERALTGRLWLKKTVIYPSPARSKRAAAFMKC